MKYRSKCSSKRYMQYACIFKLTLLSAILSVGCSNSSATTINVNLSDDGSFIGWTDPRGIPLDYAPVNEWHRADPMFNPMPQAIPLKPDLSCQFQLTYTTYGRDKLPIMIFLGNDMAMCLPTDYGYNQASISIGNYRITNGHAYVDMTVTGAVDTYPWYFWASSNVQYSENNGFAATIKVGNAASSSFEISFYMASVTGQITYTDGPSNNAPTSVTISGVPATLREDESLVISSTAVDPDGNLSWHSLWKRGPRGADTFSQDWEGWQRAVENPEGWSNFSNGSPGAPSNGANSQTSATFMPPSPGYWQFHANCADTFDVWGPGATTGVMFVAPLPSLNMSASAFNGVVSGSGGGSMVLYVGETATLASTATSTGWLSEHVVMGLRSDDTAFVITTQGSTLSGAAANTSSALTTTWTPDTAGTYKIYAEAFTGRNANERINGVSGWPGFVGSIFGGLADTRITVQVRRNPTGSVQILDANQNPVTMENGVATISQGSTFYLRISGSDADGDIVLYQPRVSKPDGSHAIFSTEWDTGSENITGPFTADTTGDWLYWGHIADSTHRAWASITPWNSNGNGWYSSDQCVLRVTAVQNPTDLGSDGIPIGLHDSNGNGVPDLIEHRLGLDPSASGNSVPENMERAYQYDANNQLKSAPERTYQLDAEGNITGN